jgi:hypothetical protein
MYDRTMVLYYMVHVHKYNIISKTIGTLVPIGSFSQMVAVYPPNTHVVLYAHV